MKILLTLISLLAFGLLSACSTATEEAGLKEVAEFYGGSVAIGKGASASTTATAPQGSYLEVSLTAPGISRYFRDLQVPASNCAYLVYKHLRPKQRTDYDYFKIIIRDSAAAHTYTFSPADLELATQTIDNLNVMMFNLQAADYSTIISHFDPAALGTMSRDSVTAGLRKMSKVLAPFSGYMVQGFEAKKTLLSGQSVPLVRFFISVSRGKEHAAALSAFINPQPRKAQYLCGLRLL